MHVVKHKPGTDFGLAKYDNMCRAIAECHQVDEVKEMRDQARAIEVYAQQAQNFEAERKACEIRIRAERRTGELLLEMGKTGARQAKGGDRKSMSSRTTLIREAKEPARKPEPIALKDLGISRDQSSKWQQLANVPAEEFERAVTGEGPKPTTEGIINAKQSREKPQPRIDADALWLWGRLRDFERNGIFKKDAAGLTAAMTDSMRDDCARITPRLISWLS